MYGSGVNVLLESQQDFIASVDETADGQSDSGCRKVLYVIYRKITMVGTEVEHTLLDDMRGSSFGLSMFNAHLLPPVAEPVSASFNIIVEPLAKV